MAKQAKNTARTKLQSSKSIKKGKSKKKSGIFSFFLKWTKRIIVFLFVGVLMLTFLFRYVNPPVTPLMLLRAGEQIMKADKIRLKYNWVDLNQMSPFLSRAVLASEDQRFFEHNGFDTDAIYSAFKSNLESSKVSGGSTISQQTAKNVFLWPGRSWIRKGLEACFTVLIEFMWPKERILEIYLNVIELGKGIYGVDAAADFYYNKSCKNLSKAEAAALASVLPLPLKWNPLKPTPILAQKQHWILVQSDNTIWDQYLKY